MALALPASETGDGPAVIVLHGLFGQGRNWQAIAKWLARGFRVHTLDLRNHGNAPWADTMSYPEMADDVAAYIADRGLSRPAVIGHSMGGKVAMTLALSGDVALDSLMIVDIAPVAYDMGFERYALSMREIDVAQAASRGDVDAALSQTVADPGVRAFLMQNLAREDDGFCWKPNLDALIDAMPALGGFPDPGDATFDGPTLFLAGATSDYVTDAAQPEIERLFPAAKVEHIPDAGHWVHADQPEAFLETAIAFLT